MEKNLKYFLPPPNEENDFQNIFRMVLISGAGRPANIDGSAESAWTPSLLADAISNIESNQKGVELRTVQLWFKNNGKGISHKNIGFLSMILGCGDPKATSEWRLKLASTQLKMKNEQRSKHKHELLDALNTDANKLIISKQGFSLARWTESYFQVLH